MKAKNIETVSLLKDKLAKVKSLILTDYRGLTHKQLEQLHKAVKKLGGQYLVVKNSLLKIASKTNNLSGPTAVLLAYEDDLAPLRELFKFIKANSLPKIKKGLIWGKEYDGAETSRIASLPSKNDLIAQLLFSLNANMQKLAYILTQIKKQ